MLFTKYYLGDQVGDNEVGGACGMYVRVNPCRALVGKSEGSRGLGKSLSHHCYNGS